MTNSTIAELRIENKSLLALVIRLSAIILRNVVEQRELIGSRDSEMVRYLLVAVTPVEIVARLREVSLRCSQLSLGSPDSQDAEALERVGVELAAEAEALEVLLKIPGADE
jgi:phosphate uptake regulator